jgi:hypothetical protein
MPTLLRAAALVTTAIVCTVALAEETSDVTIDKLKFSMPKSWTKAEVSNAMRLAQFSIPAKEGDSEPGELVIFPPFGGTNQQNVQRWIDSFEPKDRTVKTTKGTCAQGDYIFVEITGTYKKPDGPPILRKTVPAPGYRMQSVIFTVKGGGNYFFRLTGPDKTVAAQSEPFRTSFGAKAADETEYKLE